MEPGGGSGKDPAGRMETTRSFRRELYLFQGLPKGDKMELIIQKAVELGCMPGDSGGNMKRSVVKLDAKKGRGEEKALECDCGERGQAVQTHA